MCDNCRVFQNMGIFPVPPEFTINLLGQDILYRVIGPDHWESAIPNRPGYTRKHTAQQAMDAFDTFHGALYIREK